jgi:hypothetical protein
MICRKERICYDNSVRDSFFGFLPRCAGAKSPDIIVLKFEKGWSDMKRFLFVLFVLGWTIAASAQSGVNVLVYDMKASNAGFGYAADLNTWAQIKDTNTAFLIVESPTEGDTANIWAVYTWKGRDKKNYAMDVNLGQATTGAATVGSKQVGFVVDANTENRIQLAGNNKLVTIGKKTNRSCLSGGCHTAGTFDNLDANCPPSLTGYEIKIKTDADGNKKLCTSTLSLKLDIAKTLAAHPDIVTAEDGAYMLISDLNDIMGYTIVEP